MVRVLVLVRHVRGSHQPSRLPEQQLGQVAEVLDEEGLVLLKVVDRGVGFESAVVVAIERT
jgi:hypothetical protein